MRIGIAITPAASFGLLSGLSSPDTIGSLVHTYDVTATADSLATAVRDTALLQVTAPAQIAGSYPILLTDLAQGPQTLRAPSIVDIGDGTLALYSGLYAHSADASAPSATLRLERDGSVIAADVATYTLTPEDGGLTLTLRETVMADGRSVVGLATFEVAGMAPPVVLSVTRAATTQGLGAVFEDMAVGQILQIWTGQPLASVSDGSDPSYEHVVVVNGGPARNPNEALATDDVVSIVTAIRAAGAEDVVVSTEPVTVLALLTLTESADGMLDFNFGSAVDLTITAPAIFAGTYAVNRDALADGMLGIVPPVILDDAGTATAQSGLILYDPDDGVPVRTLQWRVDGADVPGETAATYTGPPGSVTLRETWTNNVGQLVLESAVFTVAVQFQSLVSFTRAPDYTEGVTVNETGSSTVVTATAAYGGGQSGIGRVSWFTSGDIPAQSTVRYTGNLTVSGACTVYVRDATGRTLSPAILNKAFTFTEAGTQTFDLIQTYSGADPLKRHIGFVFLGHVMGTSVTLSGMQIKENT